MVAPALSFLDGELIASQPGVFLAGMYAAFLLGGLRRGQLARLGLVLVLVGAAVVVYHDPTHTSADLVVTPVLFAVAWLAGFALRERNEQAEAAEERAQRAERERESAARVAVAEERARMARELHDVVAHAVSVMVLQVGAVRHRLPAESEEGEALQERRAGRPRGPRRDAPAARRAARGRRPARARAAPRARRPGDPGRRRARRRARRTART